MDSEPRRICPRCLRPQVACYCAHVVELPTRTRVVVLQHPREADVAINTARIAALCLPSASVHVGVDFSRDPTVQALLSDAAAPPVLLWPGEDARDLAEHRPSSPVTLVVVDGTWWQARKLVRANPALAALPRYAFTPPRPSDYRIRREPAAHCVSTVEALALALGFLEGKPSAFDPMLAPFRAMVDHQIGCQERIGASRHARRSPDKPPGLPAVLHQRRPDLVVVVAEANGYPYDAQPRYPEELVHLVAVRLSDGALFDELASPVAPLYPTTAHHLALPAADLLAAPPLASLQERWSSFARPSDVFCTWGMHATRLASSLFQGRPVVDLRAAAGNVRQGAPGSMHDFAAWLGSAPLSPGARGRAGQRAAALGGLLRGLLAREVTPCNNAAPAP
ncbi:MAG: DTW domain-containing protein [Polyangiaceae bacterium]|nr:DTW domain-containing protein [Polyangiaceae bacterium]